MLNSFLPYEEQKALEAVLRHHGKGSDVALRNDLAQLCNWIHQYELSKIDRSSRPPYLIALLSTMGIYGGEVLDQPREATS